MDKAYSFDVWLSQRSATGTSNKPAISPPMMVWRDIFSLQGDKAITSQVDLLNSNEKLRQDRRK